MTNGNPGLVNVFRQSGLRSGANANSDEYHRHLLMMLLLMICKLLSRYVIGPITFSMLTYWLRFQSRNYKGVPSLLFCSLI